MKRRRALLGGVFVVGALGALAVARPWEPVPAAPLVTDDGRPAEGVRVRVEVLNAGGVSGLAGAATDLLRESGFDVVGFGNVPDFTDDSSAVVDRVGRPELAAAVATRLGIPNVLSQPDPNLYIDVSVLLGKEWAKPEAADEEESGRAWWDPRGWFAG